MEQIKIQEYRYLAALFTSFDVCWEVMGKLPYFCDAEKRDKKEEYDFIFRGCDADLTIPLWASACMGRGGILWDQTTRFVIEEYEKWGYEEIDMEGNPPDYIGQMYRFLAFLSIKLFDENIKKETILSIQEARDCFERDYVQPVFIALLKEMQTNCKDSVFCVMLENYKRDASLIDKIEEPIGRKRALYTKRSGEIKTAGINNCGGMCTIIAQVEKGCLLSTKSCSDKDSVLGACVRGRGYRKTFLSSQRIRYPMKRIGVRGSGKFERISWEEAISLITKEWIRIKKSYGVASRYVNYATGVTGVMKPAKLARRLLSLDGGFLDYYNSYSSACANYITPYIYGTADSGNSIEDILHTNFLILWGHNPVETMFGAGRSQYLAKLRKQGIRIVVIDPRLSDTAATFADEWIPILPSTDSALADAMAYMIWTEGLQDQTFMDTYCLGFDADHMPEGMPKEENYKAYLFGQMDGIKKTPAWAEKITGVPQDTIIRLAREYATKKPACLLTDLGLQRTRNGEQTIRSTALLTCLTGNVGVKGGSAAGAGWIKEHEPIRLYNQPKNPFSGEIPVFLWTKAVEHGTELDPKVDGIKGVDRLPSNIKMILNLAGNTLINQHSDIKDSIRILSDTSQCECIISSDLFMTPSARFSDILLPATSVFEGENIVNPWMGSNYLLKNNQVMDPLFEARFEWEWLKEVARALGYYEDFVDAKETVSEWLKEQYQILQKQEEELPDYDVFSELGGYQYKKPVERVAFEEEIKDIENHPFATPSGKIEIASKQLYDMENPEQIPAIPKYVPCKEGPEDALCYRYPLLLIGWHTKRRCHSIHDNNEWMDEVEAPALWIHKEDAGVRGLVEGELVEIYNDRGSVRIKAHVTERIMKGVVAISQGGWYTPDKEGIDLRGSINVLTTTKDPSPLAKGNPQHTNLVEVTKIKG